MRVVVAGCAGFIGFHLCERLLNDGHEVLGVDDLSTGQARNADDLARHARFRFVRHSIIEPVRIEGAIDRIYNMACPASPVDFGPRRLFILETCSRGVWNLLDLARDKKARLLQASTSEVYGDPHVHPQVESYWGNVNPIGARSCYDEGKRFAEALLTSYRAAHGTATRTARIFNTYGPRMRADDGRALPNFISQAMAGRPVTVHGDGSQTRSFCFVTDLVDGLVRLMESDVIDPVNIGNPVEISMLQAAQEVIEMLGSRSTVQLLPRPSDDPSVRRPDITRARTLLGWEPRVDRRSGLERTVAWFRDEAARSGT
ncbi:MAG: SDR family oxidoreductase [Planctomycetia bacterium]|nr:MAG: SDR family oxidoreductase [Planctomycetia bacterium]